MSVLIEAYFPSESPLSLSGEINANKGSEEDGRSEKSDKKTAEKMENKQRPGFRRQKEREREQERESGKK